MIRPPVILRGPTRRIAKAPLILIVTLATRELPPVTLAPGILPPVTLPTVILQGPPRLVAKRDEKGGNVLAMAVDLRKRRTGALRREAGRRELELDVVRLGLGAADVAAGRRVSDLDFVDGVAPDVIVPAEKRACAEEPTQRSVVERGDRVRKR